MVYDLNSCNSESLLADCEEYEKEIAIKDVSIEMLKKKLTIQTMLLTEAVAYGFKKNQENVKLLQRVRELESLNNFQNMAKRIQELQEDLEAAKEEIRMIDKHRRR